MGKRDLPQKTVLLNAVRDIYRGTPFEGFLAAMSRRTGWSGWHPLMPGHCLYQPGEWRRFEANGLKWQVDISDFIGHGAYFGLDRSMERLFDLCAPDLIVLDVGVNIGWTALNLARLAPNGRVIGFEPDPDNFRACRANLRLNELPNLLVEPLGLADRTGQSKIAVESERNRGGNRISNDGDVIVELTTIDPYCATHDIPRVDLVKIDTEGFEERIIRGGAATLSRDLPDAVHRSERSKPRALWRGRAKSVRSAEGARLRKLQRCWNQLRN